MRSVIVLSSCEDTIIRSFDNLITHNYQRSFEKLMFRWLAAKLAQKWGIHVSCSDCFRACFFFNHGMLFPPFFRDSEFISAVFSRSGVIYLIILGKQASLSPDLEIILARPSRWFIEENIICYSHVSGGYYYLQVCQGHPSVSIACHLWWKSFRVIIPKSRKKKTQNKTKTNKQTFVMLK